MANDFGLRCVCGKVTGPRVVMLLRVSTVSMCAAFTNFEVSLNERVGISADLT